MRRNLMTRRRKLGLIACLCLVALAGCSSRIFQQPEVTLRDVQLAGIGLRGGTLLFNVEVSNPNRFALSADRLQYQLAIADLDAGRDTTWLDLARGMYDVPFSIGPGETDVVQIPVEFTYSALGGAASSLLRAGTFNYRAAGSIDVRTPLGSYNVPFRRGGMVSLLGSR